MPSHQKPRGRLLWLALALVLLVALSAAIVSGGIWLLGRRAKQPLAAQGPAPRLAPEYPPPPAPWKTELKGAGEPAAQPPHDLAKSLQGAASVDPSLGEELRQLPPEGAAPSALILLPGNSRRAEGVSRIPRHERWEIQFPAGNTIDSYARQLDFFKIELGVVGGGDQITYLTNLSAPLPATRSDAAAKDNRLYLVWQRGALREADEELARRAKVDPRGKWLVHFCPAELEAQLAALEEKYSAEKGRRDIRRTTFGIEPSDAGGYRFYVVGQQADER